MTHLARTTLALVLGAIALLGGQTLHAQGDDGRTPRVSRVEPWDPEVIHLFSTIAVHEDGRLKPLSTHAQYVMLGVRGIRKMSREYDLRGEPAKETLKPMAWYLDAMLYPEQAKDYKSVLITDWELLSIMGLRHLAKHKRDRYSFRALEPGFEKLNRFCAGLLSDPKKREGKNRTRIEEQALRLRGRLFTMMSTYASLDWARKPIYLQGNAWLKHQFGGKDSVYASELLSALPSIQKKLRSETSSGAMKEKDRIEISQALQGVLGTLQNQARAADELRIFPPRRDAPHEELYHSPGEVIGQILAGHGEDDPEMRDMLLTFSGTIASLANPPLFLQQLRAFHEITQARSEARGEYGKVAMEVMYFNLDFFYWSQILFVLSFIVLAFSWAWPKSKLLFRGGFGMTSLAWLYMTIGIVFRCILKERPPVSTLYETVIFITSVCVLVGLFLEFVMKRRIILPLATFLGALGLFVAAKKEAADASDTMQPLVAVLDTNFWLSIHVVTITLGYAAGLFAGAVGHVFIFGKLFGLKKGDKDFYKTLSRVTYGMIAFGLILAVVGTITGGIWANDSWGRFWGWDPKENGALLICLWFIAMIHGRMAGLLRSYGMAIASVLGCIVVSFSWWGVNQLNVGLHTYGKSDADFYVNMFYLVEWSVAVLGGLAWMLQKQAADRARELERARREGYEAATGAATPPPMPGR